LFQQTILLLDQIDDNLHFTDFLSSTVVS